MKPLILNKQADVQSLIVMVVVLFVIAATGIVFTYAFKAIGSELKATPEYNKSDNAIESLDIALDGTKYFDYYFIFLFIAMTIGLIVSSLFIKAHPAFMVLFIIGWIITIVIAAFFANAYDELTTMPELVETAATFKFSNALIPMFPYLMFIVGLIAIIAIYGKSRTGDEL